MLIGDLRANENAGQAVLATLLMREHNRVAETLQTLNPHWDDDKTYQEARRVVIAEIQHVTFNEFLQTVLNEVLDHKQKEKK
jgi:peroxidase